MLRNYFCVSLYILNCYSSILHLLKQLTTAKHSSSLLSGKETVIVLSACRTWSTQMWTDPQTGWRPGPDWAMRLVLEPWQNLDFEELKIELTQLGNEVKIPTLIVQDNKI